MNSVDGDDVVKGCLEVQHSQSNGEETQTLKKCPYIRFMLVGIFFCVRRYKIVAMNAGKRTYLHTFLKAYIRFEIRRN